MGRSLIALAAAALLLVSLPAGSPALDSSSLWPKIIQILEKVQELEQQNKEILQNQQRILTEIEELRTSIQQMDKGPGGEKKGTE